MLLSHAFSSSSCSLLVISVFSFLFYFLFIYFLHFYTLYISLPPLLFFCFLFPLSWIYLSSSLFFGFINITSFLFFFSSLLFLTFPMFVVIGFVLYLSNFSHPLRWVQQLHICNTCIHSKPRCGYVDELVLLMNDGYTWHDLFNNSGWYTEAQRRHTPCKCIHVYKYGVLPGIHKRLRVPTSSQRLTTEICQLDTRWLML